MRPRKAVDQETRSPLRRLRLEVKISQEKLAQSIGVAVSTIRRWEGGQAEPTMTIQQMTKFCETVKIKFEKLPRSLKIQNEA